MYQKILFILFFSVTVCSNAFAQAGVLMEDPPKGPSFACEDEWTEEEKEGGKKEWKLSCKTGYCGAGNTGETCEPTGKTKEGKPTCECKKKVEPPAGNNGKCLGRPVCGGACTTKRGRSGTCRLTTVPYLGRICACA